MLKDYKGYKGLPELVGILQMGQIPAKGLTVIESVNRLKRYHWTAKRLSILFTSRIASMPIYELKMAFGLHAHYMAEHVIPFFDRVREMRQPPYGMDATPSESLDILLDEIQNAPDTQSLVLGLYKVIIPAFTRSLQRHLNEDNQLFDHPTIRVCRFALLEFQEIESYGQKAIEVLVDAESANENAPWVQTLEDLLATMGDLDGSQPVVEKEIERKFSITPYQYDGMPARDERFKDVFNMGVNAEAFLLDPQYPALPKTIMLYFKRMREIDVPEMMSSIITQTTGKPWPYYRDMIRQLWDESRHAMMGEIGFTSLEIDWTRIPFNFTWSYLLNTKMDQKERHAILYFIEQGLMPAKTGKQYEWEVALSTADRLTELIQDYDWADEILHARIGRDWIVPELGGQVEAMKFGNTAWTKALEDSFETFEKENKTQHTSWWREIYLQACQHWNIKPDPIIEAYDLNYRSTRPDRIEIKS